MYMYLLRCACSIVITVIGVQDQFCSGGLKSLAQKFSAALAQKSSGFAGILLAFLPENGHLKNSRGGAALALPGSYAYDYSLMGRNIFKANS